MYDYNILIHNEEIRDQQEAGQVQMVKRKKPPKIHNEEITTNCIKEND